MNDMKLKHSKTQIIILAFNRPESLRQTLLSIHAAGGGDYSIAIFIDGPLENSEDLGKTHECAAIFREIFPTGVVFESDVNHGIARNFQRAEQYAFVESKAEIAYFFEDDMIVSLLYLRILDRLAQLAQGNPRIGAFAAYGPQRRSDAARIRAPDGLIEMIWNWGFGLHREAWLAREELLRGYYELLGTNRYGERPFGLIAHWCRVVGYGVLHDDVDRRTATAQDLIKKSALAALGATSVMPPVTNAHHIGEHGTLSASESFTDFCAGEKSFVATGIDFVPSVNPAVETGMGVIAQDGHTPDELLPAWLRDCTNDIELDALFHVYGVDDADRPRISHPGVFLEALSDLAATYPSIQRHVSAARRRLGQLQAKFIQHSEITTISVCFNKRLKSGLHFTTSPFFIIDNAPELIRSRFAYIEVGDIARLEAEVDLRDWLLRAKECLSATGSIAMCVSDEHLHKYQTLLEEFCCIELPGISGFRRYSMPA